MTLHVPNVAPQPSGSELDRFWAFTAAGEIRLPRCLGCGRWLPVSARRCPADGTMPEWQRVPDIGRIFSLTVVHRSFLAEGSTKVPYAVALIEFDGIEGVRLLAVVDADSPGDVEIGKVVRLGLRQFATHALPIAHIDAIAESTTKTGD